MILPMFVCLSVCLSLCARLLKNAYMDLDEMLRVDRCRDMDELINFSAGTRLLSPISYALQRGIYYVGKIPHMRIGAAGRCSEVWF